MEYSAVTDIGNLREMNQDAYLTVSNGMQHICCKMDYDTQTYHFLQEVPMYGDL